LPDRNAGSKTVDQAGRRLFRGDRFRLLAKPGRKHRSLPSITITFPDIIARLQPGLLVWIDDGKIGARVVEIIEDGAVLEVTVARDKGKKLKLEKGDQFSRHRSRYRASHRSRPRRSPLCRGPCRYRRLLLRPAPGRYSRLAAALKQHRGERPPQPLLLKIETGLAVRNLPRLIVQAGAHQPVAVMIARGDLAMEVGTERLSEAQEEILWLCEAAHIPVVWATQVLETLLKTGAPSRAEVTDAAMGQRAECIMLNKGPYITETIRFLAGILRRMDRHQFKKTARLSALTSWRGPQPLPHASFSLFVRCSRVTGFEHSRRHAVTVATGTLSMDRFQIILAIAAATFAAAITFAKANATPMDPAAINAATFAGEQLPEGQSPLAARLQVLLDRAGASPGVIDGYAGENVEKAIRGFEEVNRLPVDGLIDQMMWDTLQAMGSDVIVTHTITRDDVSGISEPLPDDYARLARLEHLGYTSVQEKLAERFHMDMEFLAQLNPGAAFRAGETIFVADPGNDQKADIASLVADKSQARLLRLRCRADTGRDLSDHHRQHQHAIAQRNPHRQRHRH
jgi:peptidoglycan hydrolase-like protein with peptidoglycan-binding domain